MKVLVTGATGFIGRELVDRLLQERRFGLRVAVRAHPFSWPSSVEVNHGELDAEYDWRPTLSGVTTVVHLAARVHVTQDHSRDPLAEYRRTNVDGTLNLARQAARAGVRRFVALSSVKVNGESGTFRESDTPAPEDPYGISKLEAEIGLRQIAAESETEVTLIRAPLVYGARARANFDLLRRAVARGIALPFGSIDNRRSFVALDNVIDFVVRCMEHPAAANDTFFVSDGEDLSTADLVRRLARAMGRPARLFPMSPALLTTMAVMAGRRDLVRRLIGSLCVDITKARQHLGWVPPIPVDEGIRRAVLGR